MFQGNKEKKLNVRLPSCDGRKEGIIMTTEKFCTKCGKKFIATGREVICPDCKAAAVEEAKKAAVLKAKRASWTGESVPVRISGRASTIIREYGAANGLPFAAALDDLLKASTFFQSAGKAWEDVEPYKSHRRDKAAADKQAAEFLHQDAQDAPQEVKQEEVKQKAPQEAPQAAKTSVKPQAAKKSSSKSVKK